MNDEIVKEVVDEKKLVQRSVDQQLGVKKVSEASEPATFFCRELV